MRCPVRLALVAGIVCALAVSGVAWSEVGQPAPVPPEPIIAPVSPAPGGREQIGTVEQVDTVLGYLDAKRAATFHYPGAAYVMVHFSRRLLLPGDYLTVSDPAGEEVHRYDPEPLLGLGSAGDEGEWAMSVTGDTAVVTLHHTGPDPLGLRTELASLGVMIDKVARGFRPDEVPPSGREESTCGREDSRDAICHRSRHPKIYRNSKAVVRLLINGVELCTAFRVGAKNRLLTNRHCLDSTRDARRAEVWFNYQCTSCGGWAVFRPTKVRGDRVLATDLGLDYTLFTVDKFAQVERFGYLELADRKVRRGEEIYIPQHPRGLPGRVAMASDRDRGGSCVVSDPAVHGYGWYTDVSYYCDTQGGSSGAPVLSRSSHQVIALHHFGGCPNSGVRMDLIRPRIARHL